MFSIVGVASKIVYAKAQTLGAATRARTKVAKQQQVMEEYFDIVAICPRCQKRCPCYKKGNRGS